ncbi:hypothetical protein GCM10028805_17530 [Spirosoma harenae]
MLILIGQLKHQAKIAEIALRQAQQKADLLQAAKPNASRDLVINKFTWQKDEVGSVAYHWFTIYNTSKRHMYTTIPVRFSYYSESGDEVGRTDKVIDKAVRIGETVHLNKVATELLYEHVYCADMEIIE